MMTAAERLDATFAALADSTRRAILARLAQGGASVAELAEPFAMSQPAISKHLKVLEHAGLISTVQDAQRRPRKIEGARLGEATAWLEEYRQFWESRYSALDELLSELQAKSPTKPAKSKRPPRRTR
ncbi:MAG TPA: metalloregulator ArsR/SmtB family transcription factor [Gemmatimonas sp.]